MPPAPVHRFSKVGSLAALIGVASLLAGCGSLNPTDLLATTHDARTYNPQTGRYEWPNDESARPSAKARVSSRMKRASQAGSDAAPGDGRDFNPQTGRFENTDR